MISKGERDRTPDVVEKLIAIFPSIKYHLGKYSTYEKIAIDINTRCPKLIYEDTLDRLSNSSESLGRYYHIIPPRDNPVGYHHIKTNTYHEIVLAYDHPDYGDDVKLSACLLHEYGHYLNVIYFPLIRNHSRRGARETWSKKAHLIVLADEFLAWFWAFSLLIFRYHSWNKRYLTYASKCFNTYCNLIAVLFGALMCLTSITALWVFWYNHSVDAMIMFIPVAFVGHILFWHGWWKVLFYLP